MSQRMSRFGVGPAFSLLTLAYFAATLIVDRRWSDTFTMRVAPYTLHVLAGAALILAGLVFYGLGVRCIMRAYNADTLCTHGPAAVCRHPIYAAWVVLVIPGICLLLNSWLVLTTPAFAYAVVRLLVRKEERYLEDRFGDAYRAYRRRVPAVIPRPWRWGRPHAG
jgi:protein-S-isoprenylcysteine O-methyltransferase Ste14